MIDNLKKTGTSVIYIPIVWMKCSVLLTVYP